MNIIEISSKSGDSLDFEDTCRSFVDSVLKARGIDGWEVSILFCSNTMIQELNKTYRGKDEATDVLSFCQIEGDTEPSPAEFFPAGDIVISLEYVKARLGEYAVSLDNELKRLLIHGILHLEGLDHQSPDPEEEMLIIQEALLSNLDKERIV